MPAPTRIVLTEAQVAELSAWRDRSPIPRRREQAAAILKVADGGSCRAVASGGLLRPRRRETVARWVRRYLTDGETGLAIQAGRGRKPAFPPLSREAATTMLTVLLHRAPRFAPALAAEVAAAPRSRWWLDGVRRAVPWLQTRSRATTHRVLRDLGLRYRRGHATLHSPDPAYDAKIAAVTAAQADARAHPDQAVLLYEDEVTYYRRPSVDRGWAPAATTDPRVALGLAPNRRRRVAACLDAFTGQLVVWQRHSFRVPTFTRFLRAVAAAYPATDTISLALDNWPVHHHPDVVAAAADARIVLLPLPTYAPWTNPVEDVWRGLKRDVLHHHDHGDDWLALQRDVTTWLGRWTEPSSDLLRMTGLCPH